MRKATARLARLTGILLCILALASGPLSAQDPNASASSLPAGPPEAAGPGSGAPLGAAAGVDIRIDLSNLVGTTAGNWNNVSNLTGLTTGLIDFVSGAATPVSIDGTGSPWQQFFGDDDGTFPDQDWLVQPATRDGAGVQDGLTGSFLFDGLGAGIYRVEIVTARTTYGYLNTITVNGATADRTYLGTPVVTPWNSTTDGLTAGNWLIWDAVVPAGGVITLVDQADADTLGMINAVRVTSLYTPSVIQEVPTLSTVGFALLALGLVGLAFVLLRRRRVA